MMKRTLVLALAAGLLSPLPARAQDFCQTLAAVAADAGNGFSQFIGADDGEGYYIATFAMPGATDCYIDTSDGTYACNWRLDGSKDASAEAANFAAGIHNCYPQGDFNQDSIDGDPNWSLESNGIRYFVKADLGSNRVHVAVRLAN